MRRFFDKCATVVDVTDKEVIDLFQDGLYHRRTFEDFGRRRPKSIPHLKDMITSWADEEDKANAKYDAIRGKNKQNTGGGSGNNGNQGGRNNNNYSGPNHKRKIDNTVAAPKQSSLLMSYGIHQQWSTTTKVSLKIANESTSMDSKKLAALPSSNQQGTWRVSDATTTATSRNAPSTLAISSSVVSKTRKDYTSSTPPGKVPSPWQR
jgi:hypothetical protein